MNYSPSHFIREKLLPQEFLLTFNLIRKVNYASYQEVTCVSIALKYGHSLLLKPNHKPWFGNLVSPINLDCVSVQVCDRSAETK